MRYLDVKTEMLPSADISYNRAELAARLQVPRDSFVLDTDAVTETAEEIREVSLCRFAYTRLPVTDCTETGCKVGEIVIESRSLAKNLRGCDSAFLLAVTLGAGVDRFLHRAVITGSNDTFFYDAAASAFAESLCDAVSDRLAALDPACKRHMRFSPGYGDLPLSLQVPLLARLNSAETLGISLDPVTLWMTPVKSITAVMGMEKLPL